MKKIARWVGIGVGALAVLALVGFLVIEIRGIPRYPVERVERKVDVTPEKVLRGKKWANLLCVECHQDATTRKLTGKRLVDAPPSFGVVYAKNITKHPDKGIGKWTDGELAYLLRTGLRKDGQYVPPPMPKLELMSDDDLEAIIAFLRSDDELVAATDVDDKESEPSFLVKFLCTAAWKPRPWPKQRIPTPSTGDKLAYGKYVADNLQCHECHSKDFTTNKMPPETSDGYMGGGNMLLDGSGRKIYAPNITMDEATGIGKWNDAQFRRAMTDGFRPDDSLVVYPMPKTPELTEDELNSVYAYLKTVPKISNTRKPAEYEAPKGVSGGKATYYIYRCDSCHGDTGIGQCDLRKASEKLPTPELLAAFLKKPRSVVPDSHMPPYEGVIKDDELGPLDEYVRSLGAK